MHVWDVFHLDRLHSIKHMGLLCVYLAFNLVTVASYPFSFLSKIDNRFHLCVQRREEKDFFGFLDGHVLVCLCIAPAQNILMLLFFYFGAGKFQNILKLYGQHHTVCVYLFYDLNLVEMCIIFERRLCVGIFALSKFVSKSLYRQHVYIVRM